MPATKMERGSRILRESNTEHGYFHGGLPPALRKFEDVPPSASRTAPFHSTTRDISSSAARNDRAILSERKENLFSEHLPMVRLMARSIHNRLPQHVELEDMVSAGMVGLLDATHKFDMAKKVQFRSYAQFRIRGAILDSLRALDWSPRYLRRKARAVEEASRMLTARMGKSPTELELADELQMELGEYQRLLGELKGLEIGTLHAERPEDSGDDALACIPSKPDDDPLFRCLRGEVHQRLADAISQLPERERLVMTLYYYEELTMKEIGLALQVVESRVSQLHSSALLRMRLLVADMATRRARNEIRTSVAKKRRPTAAAEMIPIFRRDLGAIFCTPCSQA